ncbi:MAG: type II toxin-antitoxin system HipA family toxin [Lachnospiraceae bacterium]|nr:type II toxin-antitoxin system HipA family toxin [Lachnospiraceae bacterium]
MDNVTEVYVYENWKADTPSLIGTLHVDGGRGKQIVSFEYDDEWLNDLTNNVTLDPDLRMFKGRQYVSVDKLMFGVFEDSCPDRWGRFLMKRREAILAKKEERKPKNLTEVDFLIGVYDETRMGGLRFCLSKGGTFLSDDKELSTPPWTTLRKLESASLAFEKNDEINVGAWEMVVHDLAMMCNLNVPEAKLENFSKTGSTFLTKRFDRDGARRIHFASAMTLLGKKDGANATEGSGYLDIASIIKTNSASPQKDLHELWRRIVFNMAVSNTDDHLRNHGFVLVKDGWSLSPLYDVNPDIYGDTLSLNVDSDNNLIDFNLALSVAKVYGLTAVQALEELEEIKNVVENNWRKIAQQYGLGRNEIESMAPAFEMRYK